MADEPHGRRAPSWVWVLSLALLALFVWLVGQRVQERPHVEIGVTGGEEPPAVEKPTPAPTADERAAGHGHAGPEERSREDERGGGGEAVTSPEVPVSPAPRR